MTRRLTMAQALIEFLKQQYVERDGVENRFFAGCFGIFGHGNVAGIGEALQENPDFRYYLCRNEQAMVHTASAFAKMSNRMRALVCTSSIGPGATNMVTGAAAATINRLPVLLLPGDIFARRNVAPVLQQLESFSSQDISVNDCFKPVSRYWDRIQRPGQILTALPEAMRVLTSPAQTGAVTIALPQDVQAEAFDYPEEFFAKRVWIVARPRADVEVIHTAAEWIGSAQKPLIVAGGGVIYSDATAVLASFAAHTGIPVAETQAGKGSLFYDHSQAVGAIGVTGTSGANILAREADLIIGIGTRYTDFTTASKTAFQNPDVRFVNINVAEFDAYKHAALPLVSDARVGIEELEVALEDYSIDDSYVRRIQQLRDEWAEEVERIYNQRHGPPVSQAEVIGVVNEFTGPRDVVDGSYLMMSQEIVTSIQEGYKLNIVVLDNHGFSSIGGLSRSCGSSGFGTEYRYRRNGGLEGEVIELDFGANAASLGAWSVRAKTRQDLVNALSEARGIDRTSVVVIETDINERVHGFESWWDVPIAEISKLESVQTARDAYDKAKRKERYFFQQGNETKVPGASVANRAERKRP